MRIVITGMPGSGPVALEGLQAVILAADDGSKDGAAPCIAHGSTRMLASLAAIVLISVRRKLGDATFEAVVRAARASNDEANDVTDGMRSASPHLETKE